MFNFFPILMLLLFQALHLIPCEKGLPTSCLPANCSHSDQPSIASEKVTNTTIDDISNDNKTQSVMLQNREKKRQSHLNFIRESIFNRIKSNHTQEYSNLNLTLRNSGNGTTTQEQMTRFLHLMTGNRTVNESIDWSKVGDSFFLSACLPEPLYQRFNSRRKMILHFPLPAPILSLASPDSLRRSVELKLYKKPLSFLNNSNERQDIVVTIHQTPIFPVDSSTGRGRRIYITETRASPGDEGWLSFDVTRFYTSRRYITYNFVTEVKALDANDHALDVQQVFHSENCHRHDPQSESEGTGLEPRLEIRIERNSSSLPETTTRTEKGEDGV